MATEAVDDHCSFDLDTVAVVVAAVVVAVDIVAVVAVKVVVANAERAVVVVQMRLDSVDVSERLRSLVEAETTTEDRLVV